MIASLLIAIATMAGTTLAQHLGLTEAIEGVLAKIARCNMCCTFWLCLVVLISFECNPVIAALMAILSAYLSNFFVMVLVYLQNKYDRLWQRLEKYRK